MVKKARFPLDMGNNVMVRTIEELKENYNAEKVTEYFLNGKLLTWLEERYYDEEAEQVRELTEQSDQSNPAVKLGAIFGIEIAEEIDVEALEIRRKKLEKLREITSDDEVLDNVDHVAFSQEELGDLLDDKVEIIYLCGESFRIPLSVKNVRYVGVNNPAVSIGGKSEIDLEESGISFEKCRLPEEIKEKNANSSKSIDYEYRIKVYVPNQTPDLKGNNTVLAADYNNETLYIYFRTFSKAERIMSAFVDVDFYGIYTSHKKSGKEYCLYSNQITAISKTKVYAKGASAFEIYKIQMCEALENLPNEFKKKDGIIDITDSETIAAIDNAIKFFIGYNNLNPIVDVIDYDPDEEPYD